MLLVIDAIPGQGKTSYIHQEMTRRQEAGHDGKWLYIAPFRTEIDRIQDKTPALNFETPTENDKPQHRNKFLSLKGLVRDRANIASTHEMFTYFDNELYELVKQHPYTLVIDETLPVVERYDRCKKADFDMLLQTGKIRICANNVVQWNNDDWSHYRGKHEGFKADCDTETLVCIKGRLLMWQFPVKFLDAFEEIYVCTYLFHGSLMAHYLDAHKANYRVVSVASNGKWPNADYWLVPYKHLDNMPDKQRLSALINICTDEKLNTIGVIPTYRLKVGQPTQALSKNWCRENEQPKHLGRRKSGLTILQNNMETYVRYHAPAKSSEIMWTTHKPYSGKLKGKGYARGFVAHNTKATNDYRDCKTLMYACNIYLIRDIQVYFLEMGIVTRAELYSLSELVQWIFRSRVRDGLPINLYIPSERMRNLLTKWLSHSDRDIVFNRVLEKENIYV